MFRINAFSYDDQIFFAQRLSLLLNSGISIVESLRIMKNIDESVHHKKIYDLLIEDISKGIALSKSIKRINLKLDLFLYILIKNGEEGGRLVETLSQAYVYLEKNSEMKKKIVGSLIYPMFIVIATIAMTLFLILYIFPKIIPLLSSLNVTLPLITRVVQGIYYFMIGYGLWAVGGVVCFVFAVRFLIRKNIRVRYKIHSFISSLPIVKKYLQILRMSSLCSIAEMSLSSGKGLPDILAFWSESSENLVYKNIYIQVEAELKRGVNLSNALNKYSNLFPILLITMISIGERTGNLGIMFGHCSRIFEQDIDTILKRFTSLIEPILMVFMGLIVGSVALSIILPVYEITNHLSK